MIALNRPPQKEGYIQGYATFQQVGTHKEYIFVEENATKRMKYEIFNFDTFLQSTSSPDS